MYPGTLSSSIPVAHKQIDTVIAEKAQECRKAAVYLKHLLEKDIKPKDIITRNAILNAIVIVNVLGGSTNAVCLILRVQLRFRANNCNIEVLHLLAIARAADLSLTIDDFQEVANRTPYLCDLK